MTLPRDVLGVDVAKGWIDVFSLATGARRHVSVTGGALARFARTAAGALVVFEASGGCERPLAAALAQAGVPFARVNPGRHATSPGRPAGSPRPTGSMRRSSPAWAVPSTSRRPRPRSPTAPGSRTSSPAATTSSA